MRPRSSRNAAPLGPLQISVCSFARADDPVPSTTRHRKGGGPATSWSPVIQLPHWLILAGCLLVLGGVLGLLLTGKPGATERSAPGLFDGDHDGDQRERI